MSQLSHGFPEEYERIAALPPSQQNAAERALADRLLTTQLEPVVDPTENTVTVAKRCRDCDTEFQVPAEHAKSGSKWYSLCGSCIRHEM